MSASLASSCIYSNHIDEIEELNNKLSKKRTRRGFTMFQRILFALPLSGDALVIFMFLRDVAGEDGECYMSNAKIAAGSGRSIRSVINAKKELSKPQELLGGMALISCVSGRNKKSGRRTDSVTITDIWDMNEAYIMAQKIVKIDVIENKNMYAESAHRDQKCYAESAYKQEPLSSNKKKLSVTQPPVGAGVIADPPKVEPQETGLIESHTVTDMVGNRTTIRFNDLFLLLMKANFEFKTLELKEAWEILKVYQGPVSSIAKFMIGTIENLRKKQKSKDIKNAHSQGGTPCMTQEEAQQSNRSNISPMSQEQILELKQAYRNLLPSGSGNRMKS